MMKKSNRNNYTEMLQEKLTGLYAITDARQSNPNQLVNDAEQALLGGAGIIQYRDKSDQQDHRLSTAKQLRELTQQHNAVFIINDDVKLAKASQADGVHLGRDDQAIHYARKQLGPNAIIGASCYNNFSLAQQAVNNGADYIAFGRFFSSHTKPDAVLAEIEILQRAKHELDVPIVAIGGITAKNGGNLIHAGADMLAAINDIFAQSDIQAAAKRYQALFAATRK